MSTHIRVSCGRYITLFSEELTGSLPLLKVPVSPFNNNLALDQMEVAYSTLLQRDVPGPERERTIGSTRRFAKDNREHPKIVSYAFPPFHVLTISSLPFSHRSPPPASAATIPSFSPSCVRYTKSTAQSRSSTLTRISTRGGRGPQKSASRTAASSTSRTKRACYQTRACTPASDAR